MIMDAARNADAARVGEPLDAGSDIDPVAENIAVLQHHVADIDADTELHPAVLLQIVVRARELVLDVDGALDRGQRAAEGGQNAVACGPANPPLVARDQTIRDQTEGRKRRQRPLLVDLHHAAIACDVGGQNRDQLSLKRRGFHVSLLPRPAWRRRGPR